MPRNRPPNNALHLTAPGLHTLPRPRLRRGRSKRVSKGPQVNAEPLGRGSEGLVED